MAWMMDTYSMQEGYAVPEIVTGKPIALGGSVFRHEATGAGVVMVVARACERLGWTLAEQRCVVQGFGNVGGIAARGARRPRRDGDRRLGRLRRRSTTGRARHPDDERTSRSTARSRAGPADADHERGAARAPSATSSCSRRARIRCTEATLRRLRRAG